MFSHMIIMAVFYIDSCSAMRAWFKKNNDNTPIFFCEELPVGQTTLAPMTSVEVKILLLL